MKVHQVISNDLSPRRGSACDHLLKELGYLCLLFFYAAHFEDVKLGNILKRREGEDINAAHCRASNVAAFRKQNTQLLASNRSIVAENGHVHLFSHDTAIHVLPELMRFMKDEIFSTHRYENVRSTTVTLAKLEDFTATALPGLRDDGTDRAGGHSRKLFYDMLNAFVPVHCKELLCVAESVIDNSAHRTFSVTQYA